MLNSVSNHKFSEKLVSSVTGKISPENNRFLLISIKGMFAVSFST